ncbi:hypothetical protein GA0074695_1594 [Micromonospora viridifaciens]|uniref:Uncharacterized protein n=1 Tax=Micromonospora viridifaciens TaxID=1881 RepID=A0A1C4VM27_MICVI|nr:hypothetical protein [Micromonospora viridifaciens]SCE85074.1 hypothetical protein GA0074695_1594 [Micromonospora viridifaciens]
MVTWIGRAGSFLVALALAVVGVLFVYAAWNAWDGMPPDGPPLSDVDRIYEIVVALFGLILLGGGIWLAVRAARRMLHRTT